MANLPNNDFLNTLNLRVRFRIPRFYVANAFLYGAQVNGKQDDPIFAAHPVLRHRKTQAVVYPDTTLALPEHNEDRFVEGSTPATALTAWLDACWDDVMEFLNKSEAELAKRQRRWFISPETRQFLAQWRKDLNGLARLADNPSAHLHIIRFPDFNKQIPLKDNTPVYFLYSQHFEKGFSVEAGNLRLRALTTTSKKGRTETAFTYVHGHHSIALGHDAVLKADEPIDYCASNVRAFLSNKAALTHARRVTDDVYASLLLDGKAS